MFLDTSANFENEVPQNTLNGRCCHLMRKMPVTPRRGGRGMCSKRRPSQPLSVRMQSWYACGSERGDKRGLACCCGDEGSGTEMRNHSLCLKHECGASVLQEM